MEMIDAAILPAIQSAAKVFLYGPFGGGKTTLAVERVRWLLRQERVRGDSILVLVPQRTLAEPFYAALRGPDARPGPPVTITTFASLAQQSVERYWPLLAPTAGFDDPMREPTFLSLETSQFHMAQLVDAAIDQGEFDALRLDRSRVITQVLDNLNKAALLDMEIDETYRRLELAVPLSEQRTARLNALAAAERISRDFRALCLRETLLDFSLQVTLFNRHVMKNDWSRTHLLRSHRHLVFDNAEEDTPSAHMLVRQWLDDRTAALDSALIVSDDDAGYRTFLGADPRGTDGLAAMCDQRIHLLSSFIMSPHVADLVPQVARAINPRLARAGAQAGIQEDQAVDAPLEPAIQSAAFQEQHFTEDDPQGDQSGSPFAVPDPFRFYPQMLRWTAREIHRLITEEGIAPGSIAVMAPFVSDALRFSLQTALEEYGIQLTTHRPSRPLEAEPAARTLFTLAKLAHPHWGLLPPAPDVSQALAIAMPRLDPVRAQLLTEIVYPSRRRANELGAFAALNEGMRERITYAAGEDFDRLRTWLYAYRAAAEETPLDQFFARLFGELLSQPNYGFHEDRDAARVASQLVQSARRFRWALENEPWRREAVTPGSGNGGPGATALTTLGRSYLQLAESGAVGALFVPGWRMAEDAVFLAPAYTFLLRNKPVDVQFWLDIGASGWWERLYQPLTHPFVLSHRWPADEPWTDAEEYFRRQDILRRLLLGLIRRTRRSIYLAVSDFSESGYEQRGALLTLINRLLVQREGA
ncbi:MAG: AAA family ATPase [Caldilineaceae bacterium]